MLELIVAKNVCDHNKVRSVSFNSHMKARESTEDTDMVSSLNILDILERQTYRSLNSYDQEKVSWYDFLL